MKKCYKGWLFICVQYDIIIVCVHNTLPKFYCEINFKKNSNESLFFIGVVHVDTHHWYKKTSKGKLEEMRVSSRSVRPLTL